MHHLDALPRRAGQPPDFPGAVRQPQLAVLRELKPAQGVRHELLEMVGGPDLNAAQEDDQRARAPPRAGLGGAHGSDKGRLPMALGIKHHRPRGEARLAGRRRQLHCGLAAEREVCRREGDLFEEEKHGHGEQHRQNAGAVARHGHRGVQTSEIPSSQVRLIWEQGTKWHRRFRFQLDLFYSHAFVFSF